jgi:hypothetical protein
LPLKWWQRGVFYHIYPRSFFDSNRDGIGDPDNPASRRSTHFAAGLKLGEVGALSCARDLVAK